MTNTEHPTQRERGYNGIPSKSGVNDCHWNFGGICTSWGCTQTKSTRGQTRNWDSKQNCTLTQIGAPICSAYLQEGSIGIRSRPALSPCTTPELCSYANKKVAQAREDVLKLFSGFIDAYSRQDEDGHDYVSVLALQNHIDSLRSCSTKETTP